jgi:hypothetical protein
MSPFGPASGSVNELDRGADRRSLSLRGKRGNHTINFCELQRVTVRVNPGAMQGYVRP